MTFRIQNLLSLKDGKFHGAMSPMLFAQEMCEQLDLKFDGLLRVWFDDEEYHNIYEGPGKKQGLTGLDTLIIVSRYENGQQFAMLTDTGCGGVPAFLWFTGDEDITVAPIYVKQDYAKSLTADEALEIMKSAKTTYDQWYTETFPTK